MELEASEKNLDGLEAAAKGASVEGEKEKGDKCFAKDLGPAKASYDVSLS